MPNSVEPEETLLRAIDERHLRYDPRTRRPDVDNAAFRRRQLPDLTVEEDVSVTRECLVGAEGLLALMPAQYWAVCRLEADGVMRRGLEVRPTPRDKNPGHAGIYGLPNPFSSEERQRAANEAKALRKMAKPIGITRFGTMHALIAKLRERDGI